MKTAEKIRRMAKPAEWLNLRNDKIPLSDENS